VDGPRSRGGNSGPVPRTVYIGGLDASTTAEELCEYVKGGLLDNIKVMPEKNCAFVTFVFPEGAQIFYEYASQVFVRHKRFHLCSFNDLSSFLIFIMIRDFC